MSGRDDALARILAAEPQLRRWLRAHAGELLRQDSEDDLVQDVLGKAVRAADSLREDHEGSLTAWLLAIAENHLRDRVDWWASLRRASDRVLRLSHSDSGAARDLGNSLPLADLTGPGTAAQREESVTLITRAMAALPERDRELVRWYSEGLTLDNQAQRLAISYDAAKKASARALGRLGKVFRLLQAD
jgi:RNA polymerase sigma factor (sigma-70 family)